eukprot:CAMPEP_0168228272 /NCGR_PEP_ID=MMETSP0140_2-20121125/14560_1 /TAXON_ID=44445 /ORGANISM="Pseudo-nitzschia australis, Strain 10249 10 AB" /LENGTH=658 /DNA_ID=CAMNT_0008159819 /DNA_START=1 /DNA_END=1974 /DNA_ORIENTATION=-
MITRFTGLAIFLAIITIADSSAVRGNINKYRRHLLEDEAECVLYLKDMQFRDHNHHEETWACEFTREQGKRFGGHTMMDIEGVPQELFESQHVVSGQAIMKTRGAFIEQSIAIDHVKMVVPNDALVDIEILSENDPRHHQQRRQRHLASSKPGTLRTLVVRVIDADKKAVAANVAQLNDDIFTDSVSLKTQYAACSKDQLIIEPANVGYNGIVEVPINIVAANSIASTLESAAVAKAEEMYGGSEGLREKFDLVMFCQPPGSSGGWVAYAFANHWASFYNDFFCQRVSAQMHEVGHNLGLGHSGINGDKYGDVSSMMGYSFNLDDGPIQCFNTVENFQTGWYNLQKASTNPLDYVSTPKTFVLNGIEDYKKDGSSNGELVTLRLKQFGDNGELDYYIGYNRAVGANRGTRAAVNKVVVLEKPTGGPNGIGNSKRIADLSVGDTHTIPNFKDTIYDVYITVQSISADLKDATIIISTSESYPTSAPTSSCGSSINGRFKLEIKTDTYGKESTWTLREKDSRVVVARTALEGYVGNKEYSIPEDGSICLQEGTCYEFEIRDGYGDGMCCSNGDGYYQGFLDGKQIFQGGQFGSSEIVPFCVEVGSIEPFDCVDDPNFKYNNDERKTCKGWVGRGKNNLSPRKIRRIKRRCRKTYNEIKVW